MATMEVELVSPERILYSGEATRVIARTIGGGDIAFLPGHAPFIGALDIHSVVIRLDSGDDIGVAVHGGFVEVSANRVTILSDVAELADQIDEGRARQAKERAEAALKDNSDDEEAKAELKRAMTRLDVASSRPA